jgi:hypothetical protein
MTIKMKKYYVIQMNSEIIKASDYLQNNHIAKEAGFVEFLNCEMGKKNPVNAASDSIKSNRAVSKDNGLEQDSHSNNDKSSN